MYRFHLKQNLRSFFFLLIVASIIGLCGLLWWANRTGMPEAWRAVIEREISKQGAYMKIGTLRYIPFRGITASEVRIYSDPACQREISRLEGIVLDIDKSKLSRGILQLTKIELKEARLILPVDPNNPLSETLNVTDAEGTIFMPGDRRLEVRGARGKIAGIEVELAAHMIGYQQGPAAPSKDEEIGKRRKLLAQVINELKLWDFEANNPPTLKIEVEGDVNDFSTLTAKIYLTAKSISKNEYTLRRLIGEADLTGDLFTISTLQANDEGGSIDAHADYNVTTREGRFDIYSSLNLPNMLKAWLGTPSLKAVSLDGRQILGAEGKFYFDANNQPQIETTGHVSSQAITLKDIKLSSLETSFSWRDHELFLRDLKITHPDGEATGKAMIRWPNVRMALESTLPAQLYKPLFIGKPLEKIIEDFATRKGASILVKLEGGFDASDPHSWTYTGSGNLQNHNYKGVPVNHADCKFTLNHNELDFYDGTVVFNYDNYSLRKAFDGPNQATAKVGRIRYDAPSKIVEVEAITGDFWAAPMCRIFAPKIADTLEVYRFHTPPSLRGAGKVDVTPQGRTALDVSFTSDRPADYVFLGKNLTLENPSAKVAIRGERVSITEMKLRTFEGPIVGSFQYKGKGMLEGELSWTKLSMPNLTKTYEIPMKGGGRLTGRIDFSLTNNKIETMAGEGLVALEKAELFTVPMFGPLTPLIGGVLNDRRAGVERAKNAFCNFRIKNGILTTEDFQTATTSINFAGDGNVDLSKLTLDMTLRMNARGLLGLITLPLRPFYGLFQFRGTGALKSPQWENVGFTAPPPAQNQLLLAPPKATVIEE